MAIEAVASGVIQKVTDLLIQEPVMFDKVIDQVEGIRIGLREMRGYFMDAEVLQHSDENVKDWVEKYLQTLYRVEDMVEFYVLKLGRKTIGVDLTKSYGYYLRGPRTRLDLCRKIKDINDMIKVLKREKPDKIKDASLRGDSLGGEELHSLGRQATLLSHTPEEDDVDEEKEIEERLALEECNIIGVYGSQGSGKSTLVRRMYDRKSVKKQFECHAWLNVSEEYLVKDLLLQIWHEVDNNRDGDLTVIGENQLKDMLFKFLKNRKYLIILDDAREHPKNWMELKDAFPPGNGSKVVITTRNEAIAVLWDGDKQPLRLRKLGYWASRNLLLKTSCIDNETFRDDPTFCDKILEKCKGCPLNLELIGGLLATKKMAYKEWATLFTHPDWHHSEIWVLSYNDLPAHYKLCLLYLTLFPKGFAISTRRILRLWLAEGFLRHSPGSPGLSEDLAEECFNYLVKRNLIKISKLRSDGSPKKCCLPGFLHENISPKAQEIRLFYIHKKKAAVIPPGVRRIVEYDDIKDSSGSELDSIRSYISFKFSRYDSPSIEVGKLLRKIVGNKGFGLLRVLDLEGVYKPMLPASLRHLFQLRYLGLRKTFLDTLPESVGNLPYLETLDLKRTYINNIPNSVWKLKHLRHLNLPQIHLDACVQLRSQLLTLWGLVIHDACNMGSGLSQLVDLRELGITCELKDLKQFKEVMTWIADLTHLQSLSLISKDEMGCPSNLNLEPFPQLCKLLHLKLLGKLNRLLTKDQFPPNIKVLTLSLSCLEENPMLVLSQLPCLSVLRLLAKSYVGKKMYCPRSGFKSLRVLKLWMLEELEECAVEPGGMPNIKELNIRCCHKLKELPLELLTRSTLEELVLTTHKDSPCMSELEQHVKNKSSRITPTINRYDFSPLPWEKNPDLWNLTSDKRTQSLQQSNTTIHQNGA